MILKRFWIDIIKCIKDGTAIPECYINDIIKIDTDFGKNAQIKDVTFNATVIIKLSLANYNITFINCIFNAPFYFEGYCTLKDFGFFDCEFNSSVSIDNVTASKFEIAGCFLKRGLHSNNLSAERLRLELLRSDSAKLNFYHPHLSNCFISKIKDGTDLRFTSFDEKVIQDITSFITTLSIRTESEFTGEMLFHAVRINMISLSGYNKIGRINLQDVTTGSISCQHFTNLGFINASSLKVEPPAILYLFHSSLGKCEIFDIDFTSFASITIVNSNIQEIIPTNIIWCQKIQTSVIEGKSSPLHLRESYRQLKNIMIRNNDKIEELKYHNLEMDSYHLHLKNEKGNFGEKFIIGTNKISNNHGLSFERAFWWLFFMSLIIFNLNKFLLGYNSFNPSLFFADFGNWLLSINPVRKFSDVYKEYNTTWKTGLAYFLDILFRIIYSYLIFQFISAFRKYVKK